MPKLSNCIRVTVLWHMVSNESSLPSVSSKKYTVALYYNAHSQNWQWHVGKIWTK